MLRLAFTIFVALLPIACAPSKGDVEMPAGAAGPDRALVGEWIIRDIQWTAPPWEVAGERTSNASILSFDRAHRLRIWSGRLHLSDSISFGDEPERRLYLGRWRWLDDRSLEIRFRPVYDDMPMVGESFPGGTVVDTLRLVRGQLHDFNNARADGGSWNDLLQRAVLLRSADRRKIAAMDVVHR